jgi:hypothetical protein
MPRFDGTGPRGGGPMTGRGEGYCVLEVPEPGQPSRGYAGLEAVSTSDRVAQPDLRVWTGPGCRPRTRPPASRMGARRPAGCGF